jgi:ATP-dependent RNA helicase RhlE
MGFALPTPIQREAIPPIQAGLDILASAETGSGKTAAFLLPIMDRLLPMQRGATRALVLAPTRELAAQIAEHFGALALHTGLKAMAVHGGVAMGAQERAFRKGVDLIVATPGRLLDHFRNDYARMDDLQFLVLDEADRMLDMGFLPDIRRILAKIPKDRQTLLFSATLPEPIVTLSREMLEKPVRLNIDRMSAPPAGITHAVYPVRTELKQSLFLKLLGEGISGSVLVFTRTKHRANRLANFLDENGVTCERIHGNRSQSQRNAALAGFKRGTFKVLVATDIAARGIDVKALGSVVNFDVPRQPEDYIHRVGRTARAEAAGDAYSLVSPEEENDLRAIERHLGHSLPRRHMEGFDYRPGQPMPPAVRTRGGRIRSRNARDLQLAHDVRAMARMR